MRGRWLLFSGTVILLGIAAGALSLLRREAAQKAAPPPKIVEAPPPEVSLAGKIEAQHATSLGAQVTGSVAEFFVDVGEEVYEGQLLARISNQGLLTAEQIATAAAEAAQARLAKIDAAIIAARLEASRARADAQRARIEFERADKVYRRQKMLNAEGATPRLVFEKSEREFQSAQGEFRSLEELARQAESRIDELVKERDSLQRALDDKNKQLEDAKAGLQTAEVHASADGLVVARHGEVGQEISEQERQEMFRIATDLNALTVVVEPEPPVLKRIQPGLPALILIADLAGEGIPAAVQEVRGNQVLIPFHSPNAAIKPGMTAQVRIRFP